MNDLIEGFEEFITLKLVGYDNTEINYKVGIWTKMNKIKRIYSIFQCEKVESLRFLFNGRRINGDITPWNLDMKDGDVIDVFLEKCHKQTSDDKIFIKLISHSDEKNFRIKLSTQFGTLIKYYCNSKNIAESSIRFLYNGLRVHDSDTPEILKMSTGEHIDVFCEQGRNDDSDDIIKIKTVSHNNTFLNFKLRTSTRIGKLKKSYSELTGLPERCFQFVFNSMIINNDDTPSKLRMQNQDVIEVYMPKR